jgi:putative transposase
MSIRSIFRRYNSVKNYVSSRYSGISSYLIIHNSRKEIRDVWTNNGFIKTFNLPTRYVRNAIEDTIGNIKTNWTNTINKSKQTITKNNDLTDVEKHYIFYTLKSKELLFNILNKNDTKIPDKFKDLDTIKLHRYINRIIRKSMSRKSRYNKYSSIMIDADMYSQKDTYFNFASLDKGKRYELELNTYTKLKGNIRLILEDNKLKISKCLDIKPNKRPEENNNIIGIDKNYLDTFDTSSENTYGVGFNELQNSYTDKMDMINKKRQVYHKMVKELKDKIKKGINGDDIKLLQEKINRINKYNLGKKKYNRIKNRELEQIKKHVNQSINKMIKEEKVCKIAVENLNFTYNKGKINKKVKNKLNRFMKGLVETRLEYKCSMNDIKIELVNAAYTSQVCSDCGNFGYRKKDIFHCPSCGKGQKSGYVAAKNVKNRLNDNEINIYTPYTTVRSIINKRLLDNNVNLNDIPYEPNQPRPS